jgi:predicted dehydrogenase
MRRRTLLSIGTAAALSGGQTTSPRRIRTGILGIQHSHLTGKLQAMYDNPAYEVVCYAEPDDATRKARAEQPLLKNLRAVQADELIGDKSLDLVVFEGEVKDAVPLARRVLEAGKHLHLEKPPGNTLQPFREIVEIARRGNRRLQLGYLWRHHAGVEAALTAFREGWLGEVFMIRAIINSDRDGVQRAVEARYAGGSMFELGGHMIDRVIAFLGRPARVHHWLRHDTSIRDTLKDNTLAVFEYPSAIATVISSARTVAASHQRSLEIIGTDGSILIQPMEPAPVLRVHLRNARGPYKAGAQEIRLPPQPRFIADFEELARAIQSGGALRYSWDHELLLQETLLRASGEISGS